MSDYSVEHVVRMEAELAIARKIIRAVEHNPTANQKLEDLLRVYRKITAKAIGAAGRGDK